MVDKLPPDVIPLECLDEDGVQRIAYINKQGQEVGDPTPLAPPVGYRKPMSTSEMIRMMVHREVSNRAAALGVETFAEADDFDIPDDPVDPRSPYEEHFDPPPIQRREPAPAPKRGVEGEPPPPPAPPTATPEPPKPPPVAEGGKSA